MSKNTKGKIVLIGAGGAGVTIVGNLSGPLKDLKSGFSDIEVEYIDTSLSNIRNFDHDENNFHLIESTNIGEDILGSASERKSNAPHIVESVRDFINKKNYTKTKISTYYVVVSSGGGGSGSVISPMIVKNLLEKGLPVVTVLVGDSRSGLSTINTLHTIASFNAISKMTNKPLSLIYMDNAKSHGETIKDRVEFVDKEIFKHLSALSAFLSGENTSIDQKDMAAFIDPSIYTTIHIRPGLYGLSVFSKDVILPAHVSPTLSVTLSTDDISPDINVEFRQDKYGTTDNQNVISVFKGQFPIHLVSYANSFSIIENELKDKKEALEESLRAATVDDVTSHNDADGNGLVF